jgi:hypothetical protein
MSNEEANLRRKASNEAIAEFHLEIFSRGRQLQLDRSGLLSNSDAIRIATYEHFSKCVKAVNNAIVYTNLLGGETNDDQIKAMKNYAAAASAYSSNKEASSIMEQLFDKLTTGKKQPLEEQQQEQQKQGKDWMKIKLSSRLLSLYT